MHSLRVTVSGSFHRALDQIQSAVYEFIDRGATVVSPADPRVVDAFGDFLFVASDRRRTIRTVQDRHFAAIESSHMLWAVLPQGYIGTSTALEIGYALSSGVPVFSMDVPHDWTARKYVEVVGSIDEAVRRLQGTDHESPDNILLDPMSTADDLHQKLEVVVRELTTAYPENEHLASATAQEVQRSLRRVR